MLERFFYDVFSAFAEGWDISMKLLIYGAQAIALGTYKAIKILKQDCEVIGFVVSEYGTNAHTLGGLPVIELDEIVASILQGNNSKDEYEILIATPQNVMDEIEANLIKQGFTNIKRIDSITWANLMEEAFAITKEYISLSSYEICSGDEIACAFNMTDNIEVYMAKFWKDIVLTSHATIPGYLTPVQAGAAMTEVRVADLLDSEGDNISEKNANYSELTVLYWMWKNKIQKVTNKKEKYYGLAHYRRYLNLYYEDVARLNIYDIDVVLPYPMPYEPGVIAHPQRYLTSNEWLALRQAVKELYPEYDKAFDDLLAGTYMYNYNIIVAKGNILEKYCEWLFSILFRVEEIYDPGMKKKPNRYIGYMGEILESLYYMTNIDNLKIAHVGCRFLV